MAENVESTAPAAIGKAMPGVPGVILAGGRARRMGGGDKCLLPLAGRPMLVHVIARLKPQVGALALNANGDPARFDAFGLEVIADDEPDFAGPLAGILAGLDWARHRHPAATHLLTVPADAPFLPRDLVRRLYAALTPLTADGAGETVLAAAGGRLHPVIGLWPCGSRDALHRALRIEGLRKVEDWTRRLAPRVVDFPAEPFDPFLNVNRPQDLAAAERSFAGDAAAGSESGSRAEPAAPQSGGR